MKKTDDISQEQVRSPKVTKLMETPSPWMIRYGTLVVILVFTVLIFIGCLFVPEYLNER